jgi:hypothetical protein
MEVGLSFSNSINAQPIEPTPKSKPKTFFVAMVFYLLNFRVFKE